MQNKFFKLIFLLAIFSIAFLDAPLAHAFSQVTNYSHIKTGIVNYASLYASYLPLNIKDQVLDWQAKHFDIFAGGADITTHPLAGPNTDLLWASYKDHAYVYPSELPVMRQFAEDNGFVFEDILLHMKVDYKISSALTWTNQSKAMDMFDVFEGAKGVFLLNGSTYTDKTDASYNATTADVAITDKILFGYGEPFAEINFTLSTTASGGVTVIWEYWNGSSWSTLSLAGDGTSALTQNGKITFTPPSDWVRKIENGSQEKWWVRAVVSGGTTKPTASKIVGDNWISTDPNAQGYNCRGWDSTSGTIVNSGELAYNPTPPATATAKFHYQARATGMWAGGATFGNPANIQNGKRTFAAYMADSIVKKVEGTNFNSFMFDDAEGSPSISLPANAVRDFSDYTDSHTGTFIQERVYQLQAEVALLNIALPSFAVGKNTLNQEMSYASPWSLHESPYQAINTNANNFVNGSYVSYDGYLPVNNPGGSVGIMHIFDTYADGNTGNDGNWFFWDRGNRSPIVALSSYYMAANENTYFGYNSLGWSYWETDEFYYYDLQSTTLTQDINVDTSNADKIITALDFSAFPSAGTLGVKIGDSEPNIDVLSSFTISGGQLHTTRPIRFHHAAGEKIQFQVRGHQAIDPVPTDGRVARWANTFPAVYFNIGVPDVSVNGGSRNMNWKLWSAIGGSSSTSGNVWRRDYTNAIILHRPAMWSTTSVQFNTPSDNICITGGTYPSCTGSNFYPLKADGTLGAPTTSTTLRTGEGAILVKESAITPDTTAPSAPTGLGVI